MSGPIKRRFPAANDNSCARRSQFFYLSHVDVKPATHLRVLICFYSTLKNDVMWKTGFLTATA